ncbi:MAG: pseudaminic acid cytidylyltransferase [Acidovorax sp.]|nr:pseudaminic acid cytidylyltransferase [Acidovorax sp.]
MKIAIIPARGGSKRIPRKNILPFRGKPMIVWSISAALESGIFERVLVSTDDEEIAHIARDAGARTPFMRPAKLADDITPTVPVIAHAVNACRELGWDVSHACCIYPCAPTLAIADLRRASQMCMERDADFVYPVTEYAHPVQRAMHRTARGTMQFLQPEHELTRTQDLEKTFHDAGQFYFGKAEAWLAGLRMHTAGLGLPIPAWRVVDIDTPDDWMRAELVVDALATTRAA